MNIRKFYNDLKQFFNCKKAEILQDTLSAINEKTELESTIKVPHTIRIFEEYAHAHISGIKPWEIRFNDRNYKVGDLITFIVVDNNNMSTGTVYSREIIYLFQLSYGLENGYCIMTIK